MRLLRRVLVLLCAVLAVAVGTVAPASAAGDDYPWRHDSSWSADPYGFTKRQCTSFVAWRLGQRGAALDNRTQRWGHARDWDDAARRLGVGVGTKPVVGAVAHWNAGEAGAYYGRGSTRPNGTMRAGVYGHVGYVQSVHADGSVTVAQYNMGASRAYSTARLKAPRYLYKAVGGTPAARAVTAPRPVVPPANARRLSIALSPQTITVRQTARVWVAGVPGEKVLLYAYTSPSSTYRLVRTGIVNSRGLASWLVRPGNHTRLYAAPDRGPGTRNSAWTVLSVRR